MYLKNFTLSFKIEVFEGLAETDGLLSFDADSLKLEFQTKDSIFGVIKSNIKKVFIPLDKIRNIEFKKGFFKDKLFIYTNSLDVVKKLPGGEGNEIKLILKKKNRIDTRNFSSKVNLLISENRLNELEHETF